jgi:hypothetical protein
MALKDVFQIGVIKIKGEPVVLDELSVNNSRSATPRYTCDSYESKGIMRGRKEVTFTIKRDLDGFYLSELYENGDSFDMLVYNNDVSPPELVMKLTGCVLTKDNFGPLSGDKVVGQDVEGRATAREIPK